MSGSTSGGGAGSPITTQQINGLIAGLDPVLAQIQQTLQSKVFTQTLPMIGTQIATASSQGVAALASFFNLQTQINNALATIQAQAAPTATLVQNT